MYWKVNRCVENVPVNLQSVQVKFTMLKVIIKNVQVNLLREKLSCSMENGPLKTSIHSASLHS